MSIQSHLSVVAIAVAASTLWLAPPHAHSQTRATNSAYNSAYNGATITSFGVKPLRLLRPGEELKFVLRATPGSKATLQIEGASAPVAMMETSPGQFEGSYVIRQRDQLTERTRVTAHVVRDGRTASAMLAGSLQAGSPDVLAVFAAPKPPAERVSLSAARLSRTRRAIFLVSGQGKQAALSAWRAGENIPARAIHPAGGVDILVERALLEAAPIGALPASRPRSQ